MQHASLVRTDSFNLTMRERDAVPMPRPSRPAPSPSTPTPTPARSSARSAPEWDFSRITTLHPAEHDPRDRAKSPAEGGTGEEVSQPPGPAPPGPAPARPAPAPAAPAKQAKLKSGPSYTPSGTITPTKSGGMKSASFSLAAEFENDAAHGYDPSYGEVHQFILWTNAGQAPKNAAFSPEADFPANTWFEDRDTNGKRYGHRTGTFAECVNIDQYQDTDGTQNCASGAVFAGQDAPNVFAAKTGYWKFELRAVDVHSGASLGTPAAVAINWDA